MSTSMKRIHKGNVKPESKRIHKGNVKPESKRIHKVTVKRMVDDSPDTSWLGEYGSDATSEYSIDRSHSLDCPQQTYNKPTEAIEMLERVISHLENVKDGTRNRNLSDNEKQLGLSEWESANDAQDVCIAAQDELADDCTCGGHGDMDRNEYRYFNPSSNYVDKSGKALPENTPDDVRKYVRQDYERMESLNGGQWCFIGIRAEAEYSVMDSDRCGRLIQTVSSGGLWGIESDSDKSYFEEVEGEELAELKKQLAAIGFSGRAIAAAFRNIERKED